MSRRARLRCDRIIVENPHISTPHPKCCLCVTTRNNAVRKYPRMLPDVEIHEFGAYRCRPDIPPVFTAFPYVLPTLTPCLFFSPPSCVLPPFSCCLCFPSPVYNMGASQRRDDVDVRRKVGRQTQFDVSHYLAAVLKKLVIFTYDHDIYVPGISQVCIIYRLIVPEGKSQIASPSKIGHIYHTMVRPWCQVCILYRLIVPEGSHISHRPQATATYHSGSYRDAIFTREWCLIPHLCRPFSPPQARRQGMTNPKPAMRAAQLKMVAPRQLPPPRQNNNYVQGRGRGRTQMVGGGRVSYDLLAARTTRCRFFFFALFKFVGTTLWSALICVFVM